LYFTTKNIGEKAIGHLKNVGEIETFRQFHQHFMSFLLPKITITKSKYRKAAYKKLVKLKSDVNFINI